MNEIVSAYIQQSGLDKTQAQQLMQELQALDETQLQQVLGKMQQQLQGESPEQQVEMQFGGELRSSDKNPSSTWSQLKEKFHNTPISRIGDDAKNLYGTFDKQYPTTSEKLSAISALGELVPNPYVRIGSTVLNTGIDLMDLGSENNKLDLAGNMLSMGMKKHQLPLRIGGQLLSAGMDLVNPSDSTINSQKRKQYGGLPVDENGIFAVGKNPVVVPTRGTGQISMEGVNFPIDSYDADTMEYLDTMQPNQEYQFEGVDNVLEVSQAKFGMKKAQSGVKNNYIFDAKSGTYTDPDTGNRYTMVKGKLEKLDSKVEGLTNSNSLFPASNGKVDLVEKQKGKFYGSDGNIYYKKGNEFYRSGYLQNGKEIPTQSYKVKADDLKIPSAPIEKQVVKEAVQSNLVDNYSGNSIPTPPAPAKASDTKKAGEDRFGFKPWRESNTALGRTTSTGADSRYNLTDGEFNQYWSDWKKLIPDLSSTPADAQKQIYQYALAKNPDAVKNMWKQYGLTGRGGTVPNIDTMTPEQLTQFTGNFADGILGARSVEGLNPSQFLVEDVPTAQSTPTSSIPQDLFPTVALPAEEKYSPIADDSINPADAIIGKLDNRDMSGRYLSNMKLRNNEIKLPYFQQVDLKTPQLYQQDIAPYVNNLYTGYNAAVQNIDMNSAVGQAQALQLNANLDKSINDVSGSVYNQNLKAAIDWENQLTGIYNQQSQLDNQNRAAYSDGVDLVRTNKQNVDNQIDALAYEHKMKQIQNQNNMMLSTLLHPDFYTTDEGNGQMLLKRKYNKAPTANSTPTTTNPSIEAERDFWKDLALKNSKTKVAKYGIEKKKAMC